MTKFLAKLHPSKEPAAWIALVVAIEQLVQTHDPASVVVPAIVGLVIRFFVTPA